MLVLSSGISLGSEQDVELIWKKAQRPAQRRLRRADLEETWENERPDARFGRQLRFPPIRH